MWLNYDEMYAVSDQGEVKNRKTGRILSPAYDTKGRLRVSIHSKPKMVHKIVADRFCLKIDLPGLEVDHINRDKTDNRACNLRWVDKSINCRNRGNPTNISKYVNGYQVRFKVRGKRIYDKTFKTMEEAIVARDAFRLTDEFKS